MRKTGVSLKVKGSGRFKKEKILRLAGETVLEVGCREGKYVGFAASCKKEAFGVDIDFSALAKGGSDFGDKFVLADAQKLPFADKSFDTVCLWDVLEHVDSDLQALREGIRVARNNILLSVPKEDSDSDSSAGVTFKTYTDKSHRRYYTRQTLEKLLRDANAGSFQIEEFDRIRPALAYSRAGFPRFILSAVDRVIWLFCAERSAMYRNFFALVDVVSAPSRLDLGL
jgi:ubiquinone/menaquinone biosynthesis C-methylase UbiE